VGVNDGGRGVLGDNGELSKLAVPGLTLAPTSMGLDGCEI